MMDDLKFALRQLAKNPGFAALATLTLALGIGASTAIFSAFYAVAINPYPYASPDRIWTPGLRTATDDQRMRPYRLDEYLEMARLPVFSTVMATSPSRTLLTGEFGPANVTTVRLTPNAFSFLGVAPVLGRTFGPADIDEQGEPQPVTVISYQLWQRLFGGDPAALGRTLRFEDRLYSIIGVMPPRFGWWTSDGCWFPMSLNLGPGNPASRVFPLTRLASGVSQAFAEGQFHRLQLEMAKSNPTGFPAGFESSLTNYLRLTAVSSEIKTSVRLLLGAVGFLLLIACANVANLQLARATARSREMAIRLSVGASRIRLVRQLLTESVMLSLAGGLIGLGVAQAIIRLLAALLPAAMVSNEARIEINEPVLWFCVTVSVITGILFGLAPALQSARSNLADVLKEDARGAVGGAGSRCRAGLVVAEVALSVVLLISASLTLRGFLSLQQVKAGFDTENIFKALFRLPLKKYDSWEARNRIAAELLQRVQNLPGVESAAYSERAPFGGPTSACRILDSADPEEINLLFQPVGADYLRVFGIPIRRGRMFEAREVDGAFPVALVNEAAARLWPAGFDPIGRRVRLADLNLPPGTGGTARTRPGASSEVTIIGVVADTRNDGLRHQPGPLLLVPSTLWTEPLVGLAIRSRQPPEHVLNAVRAQVREADPELPVEGPLLMSQELAGETAQPRFTMTVFGLFAALGLALAMAGIYGVLSYLVLRKTREVGIRIALGAPRAAVLQSFLAAGGKLVGAGMLLGLIASFGAARLLQSQVDLFKVPAFDPPSFAGATLLILLVATAAALIPSLRATRIDPAEALRDE